MNRRRVFGEFLSTKFVPVDKHKTRIAHDRPLAALVHHRSTCGICIGQYCFFCHNRDTLFASVLNKHKQARTTTNEQRLALILVFSHPTRLKTTSVLHELEGSQWRVASLRRARFLSVGKPVGTWWSNIPRASYRAGRTTFTAEDNS